MKRVFVALAALFSYMSFYENAAANEQADYVSRLYDCTQKLQRAGAKYNTDSDLEFLAEDFFFILDRRRPELYLFTPYYAGKADLPSISKAAVKAELDKNAQQVKDQSFPFTSCCQGGMSYNVAVSYAPVDASRPRGYFYWTISDSSPGIYDEVYWSREEKKMHIKRHDAPFVKAPAHDARSNGMIRFLPGPMQTIPDFTHYKAKQTGNGITVTSMTGQVDKGVRYYPLTMDEKLWDKSTPDNFSADALKVMTARIRYGLEALPPIHTVGQKSDCWGHAGCDYTYDVQWVAREQKLHDAAVNSCKAVSGTTF